MTIDPHVEYPERKRLRLAGHDYASAGYYFVTICTEHRACLFGRVIDGEMHLNDAGRMVQGIWFEMPDHYPGVGLDVMVVMPNHVHGIVEIGDPVGAETGRASTGGPAPTERLALPDVMKRFKSLTTVRYGIGVRQNGWARYAGSLWQRCYYERGIRNDRELDAIREYIAGNPAQWQYDRENPDGIEPQRGAR